MDYHWRDGGSDVAQPAQAVGSVTLLSVAWSAHDQSRGRRLPAAERLFLAWRNVRAWSGKRL